MYMYPFKIFVCLHSDLLHLSARDLLIYVNSVNVFVCIHSDLLPALDLSIYQLDIRKVYIIF